jgi:hypothetical protein
MTEYEPKTRGGVEWAVRWWESGDPRWERLQNHDDRADAEEFLRFLRARQTQIRTDHNEPGFSFRPQLLTREIPEWTIIDDKPAGPRRIQRKRAKSWTMPEGAVFVGRPGRWGNPFTVGKAIYEGYAENEVDARKTCADLFRIWITQGPDGDWWFHYGADRHRWINEHLHELRGKDLACWCPDGVPCHGDVLLKLANV